MIRKHILKEETLHPEFYVDLTEQVYYYIRRIFQCNVGNESAIEIFNSAIEQIKELLSYRKNAFNDRTCAQLNRNVPSSITLDGITAFYDIDYDEVYDESSVSIYRIKVDFEEIGLRRPTRITENKQNSTMKNANRIRLTESQLHIIIKECVKRILREQSLKWYVVDDGDIYNVFSSDMFDDEGNHIDGDWNIEDCDVVKTFNDMKKAFDYAENLNDPGDRYLD